MTRRHLLSHKCTSRAACVKLLLEQFIGILNLAKLGKYAHNNTRAYVPILLLAAR